MISSSNHSNQKNSLLAFWDSLKTSSSEVSSFQTSFDATVSSLENSYQQNAQTVNWMIENRGGLAKIAGLAIIPAQLIMMPKTKI